MRLEHLCTTAHAARMWSILAITFLSYHSMWGSDANTCPHYFCFLQVAFSFLRPVYKLKMEKEKKKAQKSKISYKDTWLLSLFRGSRITIYDTEQTENIYLKYSLVAKYTLLKLTKMRAAVWVRFSEEYLAETWLISTFCLSVALLTGVGYHALPEFPAPSADYKAVLAFFVRASNLATDTSLEWDTSKLAHGEVTYHSLVCLATFRKIKDKAL